MYNPNGIEVPNEWVEIYNSGATSVDIGGWTFEDIQDAQVTNPIPNGTTLAPGEALALVNNIGSFDSRWGAGLNRIGLSNYPTLSNTPSFTNEILLIRDDLGVIRDIVNYDDEGDWPRDIQDGKSISLLPNFLNTTDNDIGTNWRSSVAGIEGAHYDQGSLDSMASPGFVASVPDVFPAFAPSPDATWSMVVFGDTQNYVKTQDHLPFFQDMADWVQSNQASFNIQLVLQEGDIVNKNSNENPSSGENPSTLQWQNARSVMSTLDGVVPYIMSAGNHDFGVNNAENTTTRLNDFFSATDNPLVDPAQGGILRGTLEPDHLENAYFELTAPDGRELLIFSLGWDPQTEQLDWANQIAGQTEFENHTAVLLTHNFMDKNNLRSSQGENTWDELVKGNENFEMVFNGHFGGDGTGRQDSVGDAGNLVHQMLFNTQFEGNGGNGWIRVLEFMDDGKTVRVRTFSPSFGFIREDAANAFTFELTPLNPGDFNEDGVVDAADYTVWRDSLGSATSLPNDGGLGTPVGPTHYDLWVANFGDSVNTSTTVPEPSTGFLALAMGLLHSLASRRRFSATR